MKNVVCQQDCVSRDTFFVMHLTAQCKLGLKTSNQKNVTWGGGQKKSQKSVTFYSNDPKQPETCDSAYCDNKKRDNIYF